MYHKTVLALYSYGHHLKAQQENDFAINRHDENLKALQNRVLPIIGMVTNIKYHKIEFCLIYM